MGMSKRLRRFQDHASAEQWDFLCPALGEFKENGMTGETTAMLIPHLCCRNASEAVEFYKKALGAELLDIFKTPEGLVMHAGLKVQGVTFFVVDEMPEHGAESPLRLKNSPVSLYLRVADCDALYARAVAAGCQVKTPLQDMFWGDRYGMVIDPYGHKWEIATPIRTMSRDELQTVVDSMKGRQESTAAR
jgi:uncharacterized glyoxalase superfamily protein PhnB